MSKRYLIALTAALFVVASGIERAAADETSAAAQAASDECKCTQGEPCTCKECDCKAKTCTSETCEQGKCDQQKCACEGCDKSKCKCADKCCPGCDQANAGQRDCKCRAEATACCNESGCSKESGCTAGNCPEGSCSNRGCGIACGTKCSEGSALRMSGYSLFDAPMPHAVGIESSEMWRLIAAELEGCAGRGCSAAQTATTASDDSYGAVAAGYTEGVQATPAVLPRGTVSQTTADRAQIQYAIQVIEDRNGCLGEYEAIRKGAPMMFAESKTLLPAMRMLEKHELIRKVSAPKLICTAGETAEMEVGAGGGESWEGVRLEVTSQSSENGLNVRLAMHASNDQQRQFAVRTALVVEPGQTIVLNANATPQGKSTADEPAVYVVVTPEIVR